MCISVDLDRVDYKRKEGSECWRYIIQMGVFPFLFELINIEDRVAEHREPHTQHPEEIHSESVETYQNPCDPGREIYDFVLEIEHTLVEGTHIVFIILLLRLNLMITSRY